MARRDVLDMEHLRTGEAAALERAAAGFCDALGAERVYAAVLGDDGLLRFKGSAPAGAGSPGPMEPAAVPDIAWAISSASVCDIAEARPPFSGDGRVVAIPWTAAGAVLGVGVVVMPEGVELAADPVLALLGSQVGAEIAALHDSDELAHRLSRLHNAADVFDQVMEASSDAVKLVDLDGHIVRWNKAAEALYGWPESEVLGQKLPHVPDNLRLRVVQDIRAIAASGRPVSRESAAQRKDGSRLTTDMTIVPYPDGDGNPIGVLSVTREAHAQAFQHDATDICGLMADALSVPMASLVGYAQLLLHEDIIDDATRRKRTVRAIEEHTGRLAALMEDVALVSRPVNVASLDLDLLDVSTLVADAVSHFEQGRSNACRFVIDYDTKVPTLPLDRRRMDRALQNLFVTLLEQCEDTAEAFVSIVTSPSGATIELAARRRPDVSEARTPYGTLGLYIARSIVEAHGGTLVEQHEGDQQIYRIDLPGQSG